MNEECVRKHIFRGINEIATKEKKCTFSDKVKDFLVGLGVARYE